MRSKGPSSITLLGFPRVSKIYDAKLQQQQKISKTFSKMSKRHIVGATNFALWNALSKQGVLRKV